MNNTEKIREFCKTHDFRHQRDILSEECSEMIMVLSALNVRYFSSFSVKPTLECYAWLESLVDLEICLTQMAIYCGEESIEKYIYHFEDTLSRSHESMFETKDDIYILSYLNKMISKNRRNDVKTDVKKSYDLFREALYFAMKRFINDARDSVMAKGLKEYYDGLYSKKVDKIIEDFKEVTL